MAQFALCRASPFLLLFLHIVNVFSHPRVKQHLIIIIIVTVLNIKYIRKLSSGITCDVRIKNVLP
ncbi:hypothetical protein OIU78_008377 [Salix suchowensis]|nr:hypothetical protein OIU78_008377 [Salix suchowensis]